MMLRDSSCSEALSFHPIRDDVRDDRSPFGIRLLVLLEIQDNKECRPTLGYHHIRHYRCHKAYSGHPSRNRSQTGCKTTGHSISLDLTHLSAARQHPSEGKETQSGRCARRHSTCCEEIESDPTHKRSSGRLFAQSNSSSNR